MLSLSFISYLGFYETTFGMQTARRTLRSVEHALRESPCLKGEWEIVWGPAMYRIPLTLFDENMMFVVRSRSEPSKHVITIRGTNPVSVMTWLVEDFNVYCQTAWPYIRDAHGLPPKISRGTARGLQALQDLRPARGIPGAGTSLYQFVASQAAAHSGRGATFIVTGHSLGGALAPALALWLADTRLTSDDPDAPAWDPTGRSSIEVVSFAGPSPGNREFARYYDSVLGKTTRRIWNSLDVVPHGWTRAMLERLPELYAPQIAPDLAMSLVLRATQWISENGNYEHVSADSVAMKGGELVPILKDYVSQMLYQHSAAYPSLYDLSSEIDCERHFAYDSRVHDVIVQQRVGSTPEGRAIDSLNRRRSVSRRLSALSKTMHRFYQLPATLAMALLSEDRVLHSLKQRAHCFHMHHHVHEATPPEPAHAV